MQYSVSRSHDFYFKAKHTKHGIKLDTERYEMLLYVTLQPTVDKIGPQYMISILDIRQCPSLFLFL